MMMQLVSAAMEIIVRMMVAGSISLLWRVYWDTIW